MRVIICGSRDWTGIWATERINKVMLGLELLAQALGQKLEIVHGGCPTGADAIADRWARRHGYEPIVFEAEWARLGRAAGMVRNTTMAVSGGDICVGFLKDGSRGTSDMLAKAKRYGMATFTVDWEQDDDPDPPPGALVRLHNPLQDPLLVQLHDERLDKAA